MNGQEQIGFVLVGNGRALLKRDERIVGAGENHFAVQTMLDQRAEALGHVEHQIFLVQSRRP